MPSRVIIGGVFQVMCSGGFSLLAFLFSVRLAFMFTLLLKTVKNKTTSQMFYLYKKRESTLLVSHWIAELKVK